jgi:hypothetical protein
VANDRKPFLIAGLGLAGLAGYQLLQKPKPPAPLTCPAGYHVEGAVCVPDAAPPPPPPPPVTTGYHVERTGGLGLLVRAGPGTNYASRGALRDGTVVAIACQTTGTNVRGSSIWDQISGPIAGYVSDYYISTPVYGNYSPGLARCSGAPPIPPAPPPPPPGLPPTGKPALTQLSQIVARMVISTGCSWNDADYIVLGRRATATASPRFAKVWIRDKFTWDGLQAPRSAINVVSRGLLYQLGDAGSIRRAIIRNYGEGWIWDAGSCPDCWDTAEAHSPGINRGPISILKTPAGWC